MNETQLDPVDTGFCETCAERGRRGEPVYKMGMCTFCYHGKPHPRANSGQVNRESLGMTRERRLRHESPDVSAARQETQKYRATIAYRWQSCSDSPGTETVFSTKRTAAPRAK